MDELGFNKIAGAILATALGVMMIREVPHLLMHSSTPDTPVYQVGSIAQEGGNEEAKPLPFPQADWVAAIISIMARGTFFENFSAPRGVHGGDPIRLWEGEGFRLFIAAFWGNRPDLIDGGIRRA